MSLETARWTESTGRDDGDASVQPIELRLHRDRHARLDQVGVPMPRRSYRGQELEPRGTATDSKFSSGPCRVLGKYRRASHDKALAPGDVKLFHSKAILYRVLVEPDGRGRRAAKFRKLVAFEPRRHLRLATVELADSDDAMNFASTGACVDGEDSASVPPRTRP